MGDNSLFFVTGPPRSGSAFLANFLSYGNDSFCFHECERDIYLSDVETQKNVVFDRLQNFPHWYTGNSSSGMLAWGQIHHPLVIVHRDWDDAEESLAKVLELWGQSHRDIDYQKIKDAHEWMCAVNPHALHVEFEQMFQEKALSKIWQHCMPCMLPAKDRMRELLRMKVVLTNWDYPEPPVEQNQSETLTLTN
jgi:hypothetical protein